MEALNYLTRSIGLTQTIAVLFASIMIGLVLGGLQLGYTFTAQRQDAMELTQDILTLAEGGAVNAAWTLDTRLANEVINSVMALGGVQTATLADESGAILAQADRLNTEHSRLASWFARTFIGDQIQGYRKLYVTAAGESYMVGGLSVKLAPTEIADKFVPLATTVLTAGLIQALSIGLVLLWLSSRLVTSPLRRVAKAIARIDPECTEAMTLPIPPTHKNNELGDLLRRTNQMLKRLESTQIQLRNLATRDPLTDLPNRALIVERLTHAVLRAKRDGDLVAVLFLDLDRFKNINDSLGHDVGDELLISVAIKLVETLRSNDSIGRLGGDEFLIVLEGLNEISEVIHTVQRVTNALSEPFSLSHYEVRTGGSIGIAISPTDGEDAGVLMRHADLAMYNAKGSGGTRWCFFAKKMSERAESRLKLEAALNHAVDRNELSLLFQPKIAARSGHLAGCEALLRWRHDGDSIAARTFIGIAEDNGIIVDIGNWVLQQACSRIQHWTRYFGPTSVAVNVSARQLRERDFVPRLLATIEHYEIDPQLLEVEITETVLIDKLDQNFALLEQLQKVGIAVSIDDFGTGYSSLAYLTRLPVNTLKIDQSFVSGSQRSDAILNMIIAMAKALRLKIVAEGVETEAQRNWLVAEGCDMLQGYLISKPIPAEAFEEKFLRELLV